MCDCVVCVKIQINSESRSKRQHLHQGGSYSLQNQNKLNLMDGTFIEIQNTKIPYIITELLWKSVVHYDRKSHIFLNLQVTSIK